MAMRAVLSLVLLAHPVTVAAQESGDQATGAAAEMKALEAAVPKQSWYPEGYYDVRIAAEAEIAETTPSPLPGPGEAYNLQACGTQRPVSGTDDPLLAGYGNVALEIARLRSDLGRMHFPEARYTAPLIAFERDRIIDVLPRGEIYTVLADALNARGDPASVALPAVVAWDDCPPPPPPPPPPAESAPFKPAKPAKPMKPSAQATSAPKPAAALPRRAPGVIVATQPPAGEVLIINAFAFKVCVRKHPDPWDRFQCKWNEIETGVAKPLSGRFVYQVRWPDGTVRKGTREIAPSESGAVTFKKVGS